RAAVPDLADAFDCDRAERERTHFLQEDWRRRETDVVLRVPFRLAGEEREAVVCVLIENQSGTDVLMPLRTFLIAALFWDRQWQEWTALPEPRPPLRLTPVLPIVLYTGGTPWGSNRQLTDLLAEPAAFHTFAPRWQPL